MTTQAIRPAVDVVVPFRGTAAGLDEVRRRIGTLRLGPEDTLTVVDNSEDEIRTPGHARNRGARQGTAEWLLLLDADTVPPPDLIDRYFEVVPGERAAIVAGGMNDEPVGPEAGPAARYMYVSRGMSQDNTFHYGGFPQSANALVRRGAFEEVGGFREDIRAGEDADLAFRLRRAGWEIERREEAAVIHLSRQTVPALARQRALHGAASAWLDREWGGFPSRRLPGLLLWALRFAAANLIAAARRRDRDLARQAVLEPVEQVCFELGRHMPNERPLRRSR